MTPLERQYYNQRYSAIYKRKIEWQFTFDEWVAWWGDDIDKHGPGKNQLVMARHNDTGPYHPSNVRKATVAENGREANLGRKWTEERRQKLRDYRKGKQHSAETKEKIRQTLISKNEHDTNRPANSMMPSEESGKTH